MTDVNDLAARGGGRPAPADLPVDPDVVPGDRVLPASLPRPRSRPRGRARVRYVHGRLRRVLRNRWDILMIISAGGALGSLARWGLASLLARPAGTFPRATFVANVTGAFVLGALMVFVIDVLPPSRYLRPFWGVGVLGGYTTFSTYMLDARALLVGGHAGTAGAYVLASLATGLVAVWLGVGAARTAARLLTRRTAHARAATHPAGAAPRSATGSAPAGPTSTARS